MPRINILVPRQMPQRLEASRTRSVVLKEVRVNVQFPEEFRCNSTITPLGEVARVYEILSTQMDA